MPIATVLMIVQAIPSILAAGKSIEEVLASIASTHASAKQQGRAPTEEEWQAMLEAAKSA